MRKNFFVYYEDHVRGTRFGRFTIEANSAREAANWLINTHPRRTGLADTILVCGPCHSQNLSTEMRFVNPLLSAKNRGEGKGAEYESKHRGSNRSQKRTGFTEHEACAATLGLKGDFTIKDVKKAYRLAAKQNHPDKVVGLAPDFQKLAERKMKDINRAYEHFRKILQF